jgi:MFS family permease
MGEQAAGGNPEVEQHVRTGVRSLGRGAQWYLVATLVNMIGNGMLFGFLFIFFTDVLQLSSAWAGALMTLVAVVGLAMASVGGWLADRFGPKPALLFAFAFASVVYALYALVSSLPAALVVTILGGVAQGLMGPAQNAFASVLVTPAQRPLISSWVRIALNIGAGIGIAGAGFFLKTDRPGTFDVMFLGNSVSFLGYALIAVFLHPVRTADPAAELAPVGSYREVFKDRFFVRLLPLDLAAGMMFGLVFLVMPTTFLKRLGASEKMVGLVATSGAVAVIVTQLAVTRLIKGRARLLALAVMFVMFLLAFVFGIVSVGQSLVGAAWLVVGAQCIGGLGEACLGPTRGPLTADLAPPQLLGRYFGLQMMMFQGGFGLSSAIAGVGLGISFRGTWMFGAVLAAVATVWAVRLDRIVPRAVRLSP